MGIGATGGGLLGGGFGNLGGGGGLLGGGFGTLGSGFGLMGGGFGTLGLSNDTLTFMKQALEDAVNYVQAFDKGAKEAGDLAGMEVTSTGTSDEELADIRGQIGGQKVVRVSLKPAGTRRNALKGIQQTVEDLDWKIKEAGEPKVTEEQEIATFVKLDEETGKPVVRIDGEEEIVDVTIGTTAPTEGQEVLVSLVDGQLIMETPAKKQEERVETATRTPAPISNRKQHSIPLVAAGMLTPSDPLRFWVTTEYDNSPFLARGTVEIAGVSATIELDAPPTYPSFPDLPEYEGEGSIPQTSLGSFEYFAEDSHPAVPSGTGQSYGVRQYTVTYGFSRAIDPIRYVITTDPADEQYHALVTFHCKYSTTWLWVVEVNSRQVISVETFPGVYAWSAQPVDSYDRSFTRDVTPPTEKFASVRVTLSGASVVGTPSYAEDEARSRMRDYEESEDGVLGGTVLPGVTQLVFADATTPLVQAYYQHPKWVAIGSMPDEPTAFDGYAMIDIGETLAERRWEKQGVSPP